MAVASVLVAGCAVGPDYKRPASHRDHAGRIRGATNEWKIAEPQASLPKGNWWEMFGDADLNRLETNAAAANQQLKAAVAAFDQARALTRCRPIRIFSAFWLLSIGHARRRLVEPTDQWQAAGKSQTFSFNTFTAPIDLTTNWISGDGCGVR